MRRQRTTTTAGTGYISAWIRSGVETGVPAHDERQHQQQSVSAPASTSAWDGPIQAHRQPRTGRLSIAAQGGQGRRYPAALQPCDGGLGRPQALGELCPVSVSPPCGRAPTPRSARTRHRLARRHSTTCFIRSLAVASARRGVFRDFFANTCRTTTRRSAAVTYPKACRRDA